MQFSAVIGQQNVKDHLIREVQSDKIGHAHLFLGKSGYGTLPLALAFIQYVFCEQRSDTDSCGVCRSCKAVSGLNHPDLHFVFPVINNDKETSNELMPLWREQILENPYFDPLDWSEKMDSKARKKAVIAGRESDEIIKKLSLKSFSGGVKVMLVWCAEEMNATSANKLLKIIEEPPQHTVFVLVAETADRILQTILSRTQIFVVPRLSQEDLLQNITNSEQIATEEAQSIAARVEGNLIEARRLLEHLDSQDQNRQLFIALMRVCYKKNVIDMLAWSDEVSKLNRFQQKFFIEYALHMFRQSLLKNYTDEQLIRVSSEEKSFLENFAKFISGNNVFDFMEAFNNAHYYIDRNANSKILFTNLCFQVMRYIHVA